MSINVIHEDESSIAFLQIPFDPSEPSPYNLQKPQILHKPFQPLFAQSAWFVTELFRDDCKLNELAKHAYINSAILGLAFAVESAANCCLGVLKVKGSTADELEQLQALGKFDVFAISRGPGKCLDRGNSHVQVIADLFLLRNAVVHGKVQSEKYGEIKKIPSRPNLDGLSKRDSKYSKHLKLPIASRLWKPEHALLVFRRVCAFFNYYFLDYCKLQPEHSSSILTSVICDDLEPKAHIDERPFFLMSFCKQQKISVKFLCMGYKVIINKEGKIIGRGEVVDY
jgi:hypothetical protein